MSLGTRPSKKALQQLYSILDYTDQIRITQPSLGYSISLSQHEANKDENRYSDIASYDHALLPGPYLNASLIPPFHPASSSSYIVSQAPLPSNFTAFYHHLVQQQVRVLVNLTPLQEKGRPKSHQYWPGSTSEASNLLLENGWTVALSELDEIHLAGGTSNLVRRKLEVRHPNPASASDSTSNESSDIDNNNSIRDPTWSIVQLHLTSWPDHGVFPTDLLRQVMQQVYNVPTNRMFPSAPVWIHCSAGVGRSGTLAAALIAENVISSHAANHRDAAPHDHQAQLWLTQTLQAPAQVDIWDLPTRIVEHLRRYRPRMVQTLEQFGAIFELVEQLAQETSMAGS